jgi:transcriptional regulator with XRE-family HTH domain
MSKNITHDDLFPIRALREKRGLTQAQLSRAAGLHEGTVHRAEHGVAGASVKARIAAALDVPVERVEGLKL